MAVLYGNICMVALYGDACMAALYGDICMASLYKDTCMTALLHYMGTAIWLWGHLYGCTGFANMNILLA